MGQLKQSQRPTRRKHRHASKEGRWRKAEIERLQRRLDILYEDRLEQRINAATYDEKAAETQQALDRARQILDEIESVAVAPARRAVDLIALASK